MLLGKKVHKNSAIVCVLTNDVYYVCEDTKAGKFIFGEVKL